MESPCIFQYLFTVSASRKGSKQQPIFYLKIVSEGPARKEMGTIENKFLALVKCEKHGRRGTKFPPKAENDLSNLPYLKCTLKFGSKMDLKVVILWSNIIGISFFFFQNPSNTSCKVTFKLSRFPFIKCKKVELVYILY